MTSNDFHNTSGNRVSQYAFLRLDMEGRILQTSNRTDLLGYAPADLVGHNLWDLLPASFSMLLRDELLQASAEQSHVCHERFDDQLGAWLEYHACPTETGIMLLILDVTARQRAAMARNDAQEELKERVKERTAELAAADRVLREAKERLRMVLQNAPVWLSMLDRNLCCRWLHNPLLPSTEEYLEKTAESFLAPAEAAQLNALCRQVMETATGTREEFCVHLSGREIWYDMQVEPFRNQDGEIDGTTTIALDVTERKHSAERLRSMNAALNRRAEQLQRLAVELTRAEERERRRIAQLLHDHLQQLLVGAKFSLLRVRTCDEATRLIVKEASDMLDQSIAASRSLTAELVPPLLYEKGLPDALRWLVRWMMEKHGIEVTLDADDRPEELAQELRLILFEAIRELLFNVAKHAKVKQASVVLCYGGADTVSARVQDNGVGFDPNAQQTVTAGGFGLLSMRERLAAVGGALEIKSAPGTGTTSTILMPTRLEPFPRKPAASAFTVPSERSSERRRVLVADDHAIVRQGITRLLQEAGGLEVIGEAEDGIRAIELTEALHPDVVIMDVNMPRMNGIDATRIIHREQAGVRIIGLSMYDPAETAQAMREAGASAFLPKECPLADLLAAIQQDSESYNI